MSYLIKIVIIIIFIAIRPEYGYLIRLASDFPNVPLMVLTATATAAVRGELHQLLRNPQVEVSSVNRPNISLHAYELSGLPKKGQYNFVVHILKNFLIGTIQYYTELADYVMAHIENRRAVIYTDFVKDVAPLAIALTEKGIKSCGYHGKNMTSNDKINTVDNWCRVDSTIQVKFK